MKTLPGRHRHEALLEPPEERQVPAEPLAVLVAALPLGASLAGVGVERSRSEAPAVAEVAVAAPRHPRGEALEVVGVGVDALADPRGLLDGGLHPRLDGGV